MNGSEGAGGRERERERARRRRIAAFIEQQAGWKQAFLILVAVCSLSFRAERSVWMLSRTSQFWECDVLTTFSSRQWTENFHMIKILSCMCVMNFDDDCPRRTPG